MVPWEGTNQLKTHLGVKTSSRLAELPPGKGSERQQASRAPSRGHRAPVPPSGSGLGPAARLGAGTGTWPSSPRPETHRTWRKRLGRKEPPTEKKPGKESRFLPQMFYLNIKLKNIHPLIIWHTFLM